MTDLLKQRVLRFLSSQLSIPEVDLSEDLELVRDLRVDGDDLVELMDNFFHEFAVAPGPYQPGDYAHPEGFLSFRFLKLGQSPAPQALRPIPIRALIQSAQTKLWQG